MLRLRAAAALDSERNAMEWTQRIFGIGTCCPECGWPIPNYSEKICDMDCDCGAWLRQDEPNGPLVTHDN